MRILLLLLANFVPLLVISVEPQHIDIAILGGGPGGYTAALRAALLQL